MPDILAPGVYIIEAATGSRPIERVGTRTAAFIGEPPQGDVWQGRPFAINNWSEFVRVFAPGATTSNVLSHAVFGFFLNGGSRCYVVNSVGSDLFKCLQKLEAYDDVKIVAAPGQVDADAYGKLLKHCEDMTDRIAVLDAPGEVDDIRRLREVAESKPRGAKKGDDAAKADDQRPGLRPPFLDSGFGAFYFPWLLVKDPIDLRAQEPVAVPPSGHVAGVFARTDALRGVHKAPANELVRGALGLTYRITKQDQEILNPCGVNCIRFFADSGVRIWGARTVAADSSDWRYIPVRRLFSMIEESIARSTRWVVFEPNDESLWKKLRHSISEFLLPLWREGALLGATPEEAFFVKCDRETNPDDVINRGQVIVIIGIAPVKPAEFVIFRIGQRIGGTDVAVNT